MLDRIKALLLQGGLREEAIVSFSERDVATVCLLIEAASADGAYGESEHARILSLVETRMKLTPERARALWPRPTAPSPGRGGVQIHRCRAQKPQRK